MARSHVVLGQIALSFHVAAAAVIAELLRQDGISVELREAPHEEMYALLASGEVDFVCSAWLPGSHGVYVDPIADRLEKLGVLYEPYALWGIPDFLPADIRAVADLTKPSVAGLFDKRIQGIGPGAGISRFSREIIDRYRLADQGYHFENGSPEECFGAFERAAADGRGVVVPLWHPQYLHHKHKIRELEEPLGLLQGRDRATFVGQKVVVKALPAATVSWMKKVSLGNATVAELDYATSVERLSPDDAAKRWLGQHPAEIERWRGAR